MRTTLDTRDTTSEMTSHTLPVWPLPAAQMPNAHLTWNEWCARQAATEAAAQHIAAAEQIVLSAREPVGAAV